MDGDTITIFAHDPHVMQLGWLYNIKAFKDCGVSLFNVPTLPPELIGLSGPEGRTCSKAWDYEESETLKSTLGNFKVSAHLKLCIGSKLIDVSGKSVLSILQEAKISNRQTRISLTYMKHTKCESINLNAHQFGQLINREMLNHNSATHVVIGRLFGNTAMVTAEFSSNFISETTKAKQKIKADFKQIKALCNFSASGAANSGSEISSFDHQIQFKVFGDFSEKIDIDNDIDSILKFTREIDNKMKDEKVIEYKLISIKSLRENILKISEKLPFTLTIPDERICTKLLEQFDFLDTKYLELDDCARDIQEKKIFLDQSHKNEIGLFKTGLEEIREKYKIVYRDTIKGQRNLDELHGIFDSFKNELDSQIEKYSKIGKFLELADELNSKGIIVVKGKFLLANYLPNDKKAFILETNKRDSEPCQENLLLIDDLINHHKSKLNKILFIYVEDDSLADSKVSFYQKNRIKKFSDYRRDFMDKNIAKLGTNNSVLTMTIVPSEIWKNITFDYTNYCPNAAKNCRRVKLSWICFKCNSTLKDGISGTVCCDCGYYLKSDLKFKCGDPNHGFDFVRHEEENCTIS